MFKLAEGTEVWIGKHSDVKGKNKYPFRHIFNLYVGDVHSWYEKLKNIKEVEIISTPEETPTSRPERTRYICTFLDREGNCWQFMTP